MQHHFYAYMARMKLIERWSLRRNTRRENDQEHSLQVTMIAHALAHYRNTRYGGNLDLEKVLLYAVYHEAAEVITGDLASPIKYFNPGIRDAYKSIEHMASQKLLDYLPPDFQETFEKLLFPDEESLEWKIVKAADRISAYVKCLEEYAFGNREFLTAQENIRASISAMNLPEAEDFMREFAPSFLLPLDALN
ncbi:MAG TPA: 5'-deoxynucleotidase [Candidatus Pullichristensenella excrementigallinarum]|uniref:5'-deoxynucleotidase n=1 Tax=Candidatus Pullichristensenella excrementigallinarum TaxID=2840907 RepID=A0A9D1LAB8_9FIRM|nr:5'-deoxynucleotidase [Candidatus Pullichristensenella excrementigallinarum]